MWSERIAVAAAVVTLALLNMALWAGTGVGPSPHVAHKVPSADRQGGAPVDGVWVGRWKADVEPGEGKSLMCETVQVGEHAWKATFNAVCDQDYAFTMEVPGRREGEDIVFEATVDLGEQYGGEYHWTGQVVGDEFSGRYTHAKYNGTFRMTKSPDGVIEPGVYCKVPALQSVEPSE
ncbi:MAG: hypothetical protein AB7U20_06535 [Planctomycetaceae bacterium]